MKQSFFFIIVRSLHCYTNLGERLGEGRLGCSWSRVGGVGACGEEEGEEPGLEEERGGEGRGSGCSRRGEEGEVLGAPGNSLGPLVM